MDEIDLIEKIQELRVLHRDIDDAITALTQSDSANIVQIQRLKKQKLLLKDKIAKLENDLLPDIIA